MSIVSRFPDAPRIESPARQAMRAAGASLAPDGPIEAPADIADAFGLLRGTAFHLDSPVSGDFGVLLVSVPNPSGGSLALALRPHSVRTRDFRLIAAGADGRAIEVPAGEVRTVRGTVVGMPGARVAGSYSDGNLTAAIFLPDGSSIFVDPMSRAVPNALPGDHVAYASDDIAPHDGRCGAGDDGHPGHGGVDGMGGEGGVAGDGSVAGGSACDTQLLIDCDFPFFNRAGGTVQGAAERAETIVNITNLQFENQVGIRHVIPGIVVRSTAAADPYDGSALCTGGPSDLLSQTSSWWGNTQAAPYAGLLRDAVHMFTGRISGGGIVGCAYVGDVCGSATDYVAHGVSAIDFIPNTALSTDLFAHEAGHNWGANHCSCASPASTMNPGLTGANTFSNSPSIFEIIGWRMTHSGCLDCMSAVNDGCGDPNAGSSWVAHASRYSDLASCCAVVCASDDYCCAIEWDQICVNQALGLCTTCGEAGAGSAYAAHPTPGCDSTDCCSKVCARDAFCCENAWDEFCAVTAEALCRSGLACEEARLVVGIVPGSDVFSTGGVPAGPDASPCGVGDTRTVWRKFFAPCYGTTTIEVCTEFAEGQIVLTVFDACGGAPLACSTTAPWGFCPPGSVRLDFESLDTSAPYLLRISVEGGLNAAGSIGISCNAACGDPAAGSCALEHGPGCADGACCATVCNLDPFCCESQWDALCVERARGTCFAAGDLNFDGVVDAADLTIMLGAWGTAGADLDGDGTTNASDLAILLGAWG